MKNSKEESRQSCTLIITKFKRFCWYGKNFKILYETVCLWQWAYLEVILLIGCWGGWVCIGSSWLVWPSSSCGTLCFQFSVSGLFLPFFGAVGARARPSVVGPWAGPASVAGAGAGPVGVPPVPAVVDPLVVGPVVVGHPTPIPAPVVVVVVTVMVLCRK